ncbi:MAG: hypothetical protein EXR27_15640 [Betaproteobacteria bacterium]|nr:hypothetical protein [Betaproteobacteria bacterium]
MMVPAIDASVADASQAAQHVHAEHQHAVHGSHGAHNQLHEDFGSDHGAQPGDAASEGGTSDGHSGTKCSACAACCFSAALVPGNALPGTPDFSSTPLLAVLVAPVSFMTDGPVRPPRFFLV